MVKSDKRIHKRRKVRRPSRWPDGTRHYVVYNDGTSQEFTTSEWSRYHKEFKEGIAIERQETAAGINLDLIRTVMVVHVMPKEDW